MALKDNLKRLREQAGYSNGKELADTLGIAYPRYMTYERGSWPNEETLTKIATTLHVSMDELVGYTVPVVGEYEEYKDWLESYGYDVKEEGQAVRVFYHDPDGALQDFNDLESPAEFETREEFCKAVRNSLKAVAARVEKDSEQERIRAVYDTLLCKTMFSE
ncbi:helix-turn-helix transcriptional regulator [Mitsuokella jalaludinii]|uniref:helix-turn-helix domain-containing protein n=1 Tax=Mitsuokella jalaludinii TaxID=187979 RepID=UPI002FDA788E